MQKHKGKGRVSCCLRLFFFSAVSLLLVPFRRYCFLSHPLRRGVEVFAAAFVFFLLCRFPILTSSNVFSTHPLELPTLRVRRMGKKRWSPNGTHRGVRWIDDDGLLAYRRRCRAKLGRRRSRPLDQPRLAITSHWMQLAGGDVGRMGRPIKRVNPVHGGRNIIYMVYIYI